MTTKQIETGIGYAKKSGIYAHNCFMLGFPWDTMETMQQTFDFACKLNGEFSQFAIATPLPGTPFYDMMKAQGKLIGEDWDRDSFQGSAIKMEHLTKEQVNEFARSTYTRYYLRPRYIFLMARNSMRSFDHFRQTIRIAPNFLKKKAAGWI
jgi:anaerobic magnesium-protoporphyrin IX monomethyl ester cyclase